VTLERALIDSLQQVGGAMKKKQDYVVMIM
jgi:hypothetical protein